MTKGTRNEETRRGSRTKGDEKLRGSCLGLFAVMVGGGIASGAFAQDSVEHGRALATQYCSGCHAVGVKGESPNLQAPPFRTLSERYPIDALEETFVDAINTGHPEMPVFEASPEQIGAILDYIAEIME